MLIEVSMLKNYGPTNLNRDDAGMPKTCEFGGVTRGRISSQCLKRTWRKSELFVSAVGTDNLGIRTREMPTLVCDKLGELDSNKPYLESAKKILAGIGQKDKKDKEDDKSEKETKTDTTKKKEDKTITQQVIFYSSQDISTLVEVMQKLISDTSLDAFKKLKPSVFDGLVQKRGVRPVSVDIALFGRMVTSDAFHDVEGSLQVSHAISTNRVVMESDFFTAMDDMLSGGEMKSSGAGMMDDVDYDSCCYYLYASLDTDKLAHNLQGANDIEALIKQVVPALLRAMAFSNPSGKQNSFASHSLPVAVLVECKEQKIPVSYMNAFIKPAVASRQKDLIEDSIDKLVNEVKCTTADFSLPVEKRLWFCSSKYADEKFPDDVAMNCKDFNTLIDSLASLL